MIVETRRMRLRPVDLRDVDDLVYLDSDPAVMRFVNGGEPTPLSEIAEWVVPRAQSELRTGRGGMWVAIDQRYQAFLGWVALRAPRHSHRPEMELSYRLRRETWGRGLATEAARAVLTLAFEDLNAERVFASTTIANTASRRVMEKLDMRASSPATAMRGVDVELEYELLRANWNSVALRWYPQRSRPADLTA
ncbi:GNAT family N-acetyltransferase [Gordonia sp. NPDC003425]